MQLWFYILVLVGLSGTAQAGEKLKFHMLRQNDELERPHSDEASLSSSLKYVPLGGEAYFSLGGSLRTQAESFYREQFIIEDQSDHLWFLNRLLLHSYWHLSSDFTVFLELNSSTVLNKEQLSPVDKDVLSVNQLFVTYLIHKKASLLIGRENLMLGSRRLVDIREGPNVRRSFDLVRLIYEFSVMKGTVFFGRPVEVKDDLFDNSIFENEESLFGAFNTFRMNGRHALDIYWLFQDDQSAVYNSLPDQENRHSIGLRHFGKLGWATLNNEMVYQFGSFGESTISAWTVSLNLERGLSLFGIHGSVGIKSEVISGDSDPDDTRQNTFDALYPRGAYFGRVARFGPANLVDLHPYVNLHEGAWFFELDYDAFWRYSRNDAVYNAALTPEYQSIAQNRFIAHQIGGLISYQFRDFWSLELESNIIFPGEFLKNTIGDKTLFHIVLTSEVKF